MRVSTAPLLPSLLVLLGLITQKATAQCTICSDGSTPTGSLGGIPCTDFEADLEFTDAASDTCREFQLAAYQDCNCPEFSTNDYCPLCQDGHYSIPHPDRPIVVWRQQHDDANNNNNSQAVAAAAEFVTCQQVLFGNVKVEGECERNAAAAFYCGCPEAVAPTNPVCHLCSAGRTTTGDNNTTTPEEDTDTVFSQQQSSSSNATTTTTQDDWSALLFLNRRVPPLFQATCLDYEQAATGILNTTDQCQSLGADLPIYLSTYCGCPAVVDDDTTGVGVAKETACPLCPATDTVVAKNRPVPLWNHENRTTVSCEEWDQVAATVHNVTYCDAEIVPLRDICCILTDANTSVNNNDTTSNEDEPGGSGEEEGGTDDGGSDSDDGAEGGNSTDPETPNSGTVQMGVERTVLVMMMMIIMASL